MLKVLIVDDEPWVLEGLRTMVDWEKYGYEVCGEALNGPDALSLIQELKPELVLTDINIPVMNGLELIARVNEIMANPPRFVILSGYDDFQYARTALRQRVEQYLLKPIDEEEIGALLEKLRLSIQNEIATKSERRKNRVFLMNNLINRFIQGESGEELQLAANTLMKLRPDAEFMCILAAASSCTSDLLEEAAASCAWEWACSFQDGAGRPGLLVQTASMSRDCLETAVVRLQKELSDRLQEPVGLMLSERLTGAAAIRELYSQSLEVWKFKYHKDKGGMFPYGELRSMKKEAGLHEESFKGLLEKVKTGTQEEIRHGVKGIFEGYAERLLTVETVRAGAAHLEMILCRYIADMNGNPDRILMKMQSDFGNLSGLGDYFMLNQYVTQLCLQTASYLEELKHANEGNTIFNVIQYVDLEFRNKLQLQDLAKQFHMNSAYLGQLFRKETGSSFSEYVNEKRIEAAKGLLKRTQLKISDIALQVGFSNTDYFIDKFKTVVGVVPSVYKKCE